jgi:hypothetical protein
MHRTRTVVTIAAAALSPLSFAMLGLEGTASAQPGLHDCAAALGQEQGLSQQKAKNICKGTPQSVHPDLDDCAAVLAQDQGLSRRKAKKVCDSTPLH